MFSILLSFLCCALSLKYFYEKLKISYINMPSLVNHPVLNLLYSNYKFSIGKIEDRQSYLNSLTSKYDKYFQCWYGLSLTVVVTGPEQIRKVFASPKCSEKLNLIYDFIDTKNSLVSGSMLHRWPVSRKFCNTSFSVGSIESMRVNFEKNAKSLRDSVDKRANNEVEFDILELTKPISFEIFSEVFLGLSDYKYEKEFMDTMELNVRTCKRKTLLPYFYPQTFYKLTKLYREELKGKQIQKDLITYAIEMRNKKQQENNLNMDEVENLMIDRFLANQDKFSSEEIVDLLNNIMSSVESFGNFISNTVLLLAMHPRTQEKAYEELKSVLGDEDYDVLTSEKTNQLKYMEMVMKESMRLVPLIPLLFREVLGDFEIDDGVIVPKSTTICINLQMLHLNKAHWGEDAEIFEPDRFSDERWNSNSSNFFYPFAAGQRVCIGKRFTYVAGKIVLARLLRDFKFKTSLTEKDLDLKNFEAIIVNKLKLPHLVSAEQRI